MRQTPGLLVIEEVQRVPELGCGRAVGGSAARLADDWIVGPGAGQDGGRSVFEGTPADVVAAYVGS